MPKIKSWHDTHALAWIQNILQERFGYFFQLELQNDENIIVLSLPGEIRSISMALDAVSFTRTDSELPCSQWSAVAEGWKTAIDPVLPAPGASKLPSPLIEPTEQGYRIHYDILGLVYWLLSRLEEVGCKELDIHGRFAATSSHAYKHDYLERPIVDEWLYVLAQVIKHTWPGIQLIQHIFSINLSHDVDRPSLYAFKPWNAIARLMAGHVLKRHDLASFCTAPLVKLSSKKKLHHADPYNTFDWLMDVSEENGISSAFYFICGRTSDIDSDYELEHSAIRELIRRIHLRGHEIGLHPSYGSYKSPLLIKQEADRLKRIAAEEGVVQHNWGGRMHYLRWEHPTTLRACTDAALNYDSTMGYADRPGFRCGTCFEYPAFDPVSRVQTSLRIRPLIVMEKTVISVMRSELSANELEFKVKQLKERCRKVGGVFVLLWHNSSLINADDADLYKRIIAY